MPSTSDQIKKFFKSVSLKQVAVLFLEEYVAWIFRYIPGFEGFTARYLFYKLLCKKLDSFPFIFPGAHLQHCYGIEAGKNLNINRGVHIYGRGGVKFGDYVLRPHRPQRRHHLLAAQVQPQGRAYPVPGPRVGAGRNRERRVDRRQRGDTARRHRRRRHDNRRGRNRNDRHRSLLHRRRHPRPKNRRAHLTRLMQNSTAWETSPDLQSMHPAPPSAKPDFGDPNARNPHQRNHLWP